MCRTLAALLSQGRNDRLFPIVNTINDLIKMREDTATRMYAYLASVATILVLSLSGRYSCGIVPISRAYSCLLLFSAAIMFVPLCLTP